MHEAKNINIFLNLIGKRFSSKLVWSYLPSTHYMVIEQTIHV